MKKMRESIRECVKEYIISCCYNLAVEDIHTLLERLWDCYTNHNPIDSQEIRRNLEALGPIMDTLSWEQQNELFDTVCALTLAYEQAAFLTGMRTGAGLMMELER